MQPRQCLAYVTSLNSVTLCIIALYSMCRSICLRYKPLLYVPAGMALATLFVTMPFVVRELIPILETMDLSEEEAARTMGASDWQVFWNVTLPNIRYGLLYGIVLTNAVCSTICSMLCWRFGIFPTLLTCHSCWSATPTFPSCANSSLFCKMCSSYDYAHFGHSHGHTTHAAVCWVVAVVEMHLDVNVCSCVLRCTIRLLYTLLSDRPIWMGYSFNLRRGVQFTEMLRLLQRAMGEFGAVSVISGNIIGSER